MSKMRMPEMDVVRFQEGDVICSSIRIWNTKNTTAHDMKMTVGNEEVFSNKVPGGYDNIKNYFDPVPSTDNQFSFDNGSVTHTQTWIQSSDSQGEEQDFDGWYKYMGDGIFKRQ